LPGRRPRSRQRRQGACLDYALVLILGLAAGTLGGIVGFGTSVMLMPALVLVYGPQRAVPIMAIAGIMGNCSRVVAWWSEVNWRTTLAYSAGAIPGVVLGARTLLVLPPGVVEIVLGVFFIALIPVRRWMAAQHWRLNLWHMAAAGAGVGFLSGIVASTGPVNTPFFLMHGLVKGAFLGTEAAASMIMFIAKAIAFRSLGALPLQTITEGVIVGSSLVAGAFIGKRYVRLIEPEKFRLLMDGLLLVAGVVMLWAAVVR
jgi:uncharacterized membrane protein YfcA